jgi:hypothetical protein
MEERMLNRKLIITACAVAALGMRAYGGGFWLQLGNPEASAEARSAKAVLTLEAVGCHDPGKAEITGTAIGVVNGKRENIPLTLTPLSKPGMYAVAKQWPDKGNWILQFVGHNTGMTTSALVSAGPDGVKRTGAKFFPREPNAADLEPLLAQR